jgi:hypothetical protein
MEKGGLTMTGTIRPAFGNWVQYSQSLGFVDFVSPEDDFFTELFSNAKWSRHAASGIYTWITDSGEAFVGKAVKVRSRLKQHWNNHRKIAYAAFQPFPSKQA